MFDKCFFVGNLTNPNTVPGVVKKLKHYWKPIVCWPSQLLVHSPELKTLNLISNYTFKKRSSGSSLNSSLMLFSRKYYIYCGPFSTMDWSRLVVLWVRVCMCMCLLQQDVLCVYGWEAPVTMLKGNKTKRHQCGGWCCCFSQFFGQRRFRTQKIMLQSIRFKVQWE